MPQKVKILYLVENFEIGGLERVVETTYDNLDKKKFDPTIWCISSGGDLAEKFILDSKNLKILNIKNYHNPFNIIKLAYEMRKEKFEIAHSHGYFANTIGRMAAFIAKVPIIISHNHTYGNLRKKNFIKILKYLLREDYWILLTSERRKLKKGQISSLN